MNKTTKISREKGTLPDKYWNQLNGESAQKNYADQKKKIQENLKDDSESNTQVVIKSEIKVK